MDHILHEFKFLAFRLPHMESLWTNAFYYLLYLCMLATEKKIQDSNSVSFTYLVLSPSNISKNIQDTPNP